MGSDIEFADRAVGGEFRWAVWAMPIAIDAMADLGMLAGIRAEKLSRNGGQHVTVPEIRRALTAHDLAATDSQGVFLTYATAELAAPRPTLLEGVLAGLVTRPYMTMQMSDTDTLADLGQKWAAWIEYLAGRSTMAASASGKDVGDQKGLNVVFISRQLGHATPSTTMEVYAHEFARREHGEAARTALGGELPGAHAGQAGDGVGTRRWSLP